MFRDSSLKNKTKLKLNKKNQNEMVLVFYLLSVDIRKVHWPIWNPGYGTVKMTILAPQTLHDLYTSPPPQPLSKLSQTV